MFSNSRKSSESQNNSIECANLTQQFNKHLHIEDKSAEIQRQDHSLKINQNTNQKEINFQNNARQFSKTNQQIEVINIAKKRKLVQKPLNNKIEVIELLSDSEQDQIIEKKVAQQKLKFLIDQAVLSGSKFNILKTLYKYYIIQKKTQALKQQQFRGMILAYFAEKANLNLKNGYFKSRIQASKNQEFLQNQYILYGVDMMSTSGLKKMFFNQNPSIKWIDSSHCKLIFESKMLGWQMVVENRKAPKQGKDDFGGNLDLKKQGKQIYQHQMEYQDQQQTEAQKYIKQTERIKKHFVLLKNYVELTQYYQLGFKRRLFIRNAALSQILIQGPQQSKQSKQIQVEEKLSPQVNQQNLKDNNFTLFRETKQSFEQKLMSYSIIKQKFQQIQQKNQKDRHKKKKGYFTFNSSQNSRKNYNQKEKKHYQPYQKTNYNLYQRRQDFRNLRKNQNQNYWKQYNNMNHNNNERIFQKGYQDNFYQNEINHSRRRSRDYRKGKQTRMQRNQRIFDSYLKEKELAQQRQGQKNKFSERPNQNYYNHNDQFQFQQNKRNQNYHYPYQPQPQQNINNYHQTFQTNPFQSENNFINSQYSSNYEAFYQKNTSVYPQNFGNGKNPLNQNIFNQQSEVRHNQNNFYKPNNKNGFKDKVNNNKINTPFQNKQSQQIQYVYKTNKIIQKSLEQEFKSDLQITNKIGSTQLSNNLSNLLNKLNNQDNFDPVFNDDESSDLSFILEQPSTKLKIQNKSNKIGNNPDIYTQNLNKNQEHRNNMNLNVQKVQYQKREEKGVKKKKIRIQNINKMKPDGNLYLDLQNQNQ